MREDRGRHGPAAPVPASWITAKCVVWRPAPPVTGNWPRTISGCAASSPRRSDSSAPPASALIPGRRPDDQGKLPFGNNRPLLTTTISRHADPPETLPPVPASVPGYPLVNEVSVWTEEAKGLPSTVTVVSVLTCPIPFTIQVLTVFWLPAPAVTVCSSRVAW